MEGWVSRVRAWRERAGLSQAELAARIGTSRQAVVAIESGHQVPSTASSLKLARALGCRVEELFSMEDGTLEVDVEPGLRAPGARLRLARIGPRWVGLGLDAVEGEAADGILARSGPAGSVVQLLVETHRLERNILIAGCAPLIGTLAGRINRRFDDVRVVWLEAHTERALSLLAEGRVHVAGVHGLGDPALAGDWLWVTLTLWRQGLIVRADNPRGIRDATDLLRSDVRLAAREPGAGSTRLLNRRIREAGADPDGLAHHPRARGHAEVARQIRMGWADAGVAIEAVAQDPELRFVPWAEERFDLVMDRTWAETAAGRRLLDAMAENAFRLEAARLPGYDLSACGNRVKPPC